VTSGLENSSDKGTVFNSGIIPYTSFFQYTFANASEYVYHCDIHPWRVAKVSVSDAFEKGDNFIMASGTGSTISLSKNDRTLLDFRPTTVTAHETMPLTILQLLAVITQPHFLGNFSHSEMIFSWN
jgi:hypothetical protein